MVGDAVQCQAPFNITGRTIVAAKVLKVILVKEVVHAGVAMNELRTRRCLASEFQIVCRGA